MIAVRKFKYLVGTVEETTKHKRVEMGPGAAGLRAGWLASPGGSLSQGVPYLRLHTQGKAVGTSTRVLPRILLMRRDRGRVPPPSPGGPWLAE